MNSIFSPFTTVKVALSHFEKLLGYLILATRASKYSMSCPVEIPQERVFMCIYHASFWYWT